METLYGNTTGLKPQQARALRSLYRRSVRRQRFISAPLARTLTEISQQTGRRIGLLIDRAGRVDKVIIGDAHRVFLPDLGRNRAGSDRFRGVRLVLTSFGPEDLSEEDLTDLALLRLDAIVSIQVLQDGLPGAVHLGYLLPPDSDAPWRTERQPSVHDWEDDWVLFIADLEEQFRKSQQLQSTDSGQRAILVGITLSDRKAARRGLAELERLAETAGLCVVDTVLQNRQKLDGRTCIGRGKLQQLVIRSMHLNVEVLIFDRELSPSQLRNIATTTELNVLDRTQLILDIFAQHAQTREGKLQVELAQLRYRMPRLKLMPTAMSRLTGGIGGRGPGETKLEINKRRAQERLTRLERELSKRKKARSTRRSRRSRSSIPIVSIVGYTNAGKSTLLNRLTRSEVLAENKLFATLDTTTRRFRFPMEREIIVTDTVGFIENLPATLIEAFRSTLEELQEADLLLHVLDASDPNFIAHENAVHEVLEHLKLTDTPVMKVWNKMDLIDAQTMAERTHDEGGHAVSAISGDGCDALLDRIESALFQAKQDQQAEVLQP